MKLEDLQPSDVLVLTGSRPGEYRRSGTEKNRLLGRVLRFVGPGGSVALFSYRTSAMTLEQIGPGRYRFPTRGSE